MTLGDVLTAVAAALENWDELPVVGYAVDLERGPVDPPLAVGIAADPRVPGVAGQLTDVVDGGWRCASGSLLPARSNPAAEKSAVRAQSTSCFSRSIQVSIEAPTTPSRSITALICSSLNWRSPGAKARQF